jgi:hypothetical protein
MNLIIPMMSEKHIAARGQKSSRYSSDGPTDLPAAGGAGIGAARTKAVMDHRTVPSKKDTCVLHGIVFIQQARADRTNLWALEQAANVFIPFFGEHPHIVIGEDQQRRIDGFDGTIVEPRPIKGLVQS